MAGSGNHGIGWVPYYRVIHGQEWQASVWSGSVRIGVERAFGPVWCGRAIRATECRGRVRSGWKRLASARLSPVWRAGFWWGSGRKAGLEWTGAVRQATTRTGRVSYGLVWIMGESDYSDSPSFFNVPRLISAAVATSRAAISARCSVAVFETSNLCFSASCRSFCSKEICF